MDRSDDNSSAPSFEQDLSLPESRRFARAGADELHTARTTTQSAAASAAAPELVGLLTHEDLDRARDRWNVARARWKGRRSRALGGFRLLWLLVGPGILVFLGEN